MQIRVIHANTSKQIHTIFVLYRVTSVARERAQRAQRAKRRKDTTSSHEQLQGAPFSSVRRHVPASLIIITRFPFTYQTGFKGGPKFNDFSHRFLHRFWGRFGLPFWTKNHVFFDDFLHQFPSFDFYVIIDVFWSVFGPLDIPKSRFNCRKTAIFMDLHVFAKLSILSIISYFFGRFGTQFLTYFRIFFGYSFMHRFLMIFGPKMMPKMAPKIDPKITQNAHRARLRPGTLPGSILGSFLLPGSVAHGPFLGPFLT